MVAEIFRWWKRHGFACILYASILFILIAWLLGWKPKKGSAGSMRDLREMFAMGVKKPKRKRNMKKSEEQCRKIIEAIFAQPFPSQRPDFLRNPETNRNMECDMMNGDLKLCIERNGEQHYRHVEHFHTAEEFRKQQERDVLKTKLLTENGYRLIVIPYTVHPDAVEEYICSELSKIPEYRERVERYLKSK
jgi:hypothetical protein